MLSMGCSQPVVSAAVISRQAHSLGLWWLEWTQQPYRTFLLGHGNRTCFGAAFLPPLLHSWAGLHGWQAWGLAGSWLSQRLLAPSHFLLEAFPESLVLFWHQTWIWVIPGCASNQCTTLSFFSWNLFQFESLNGHILLPINLLSYFILLLLKYLYMCDYLAYYIGCKWTKLSDWFICRFWGFFGVPQQLSSKESACSAGDAGVSDLIPRWGRSPKGGHSNPLQYSCLENPMDRIGWWAMVHRVTKGQTQLKWHHTCTHEVSLVVVLFKMICLLPFSISTSCCPLLTLWGLFMMASLEILRISAGLKNYLQFVGCPYGLAGNIINT